MGNITVFTGQTVPYLALWDDVIEGSPHPKLNGYPRAIPGGACGAKGLGARADMTRFKRTATPDKNTDRTDKNTDLVCVFVGLCFSYALGL